jgi:hypothetical protein
MAILNVKLPTNLTEYPNSFKRQGSFPLEAYSVFYAITDESGAVTTTALDAAKDYAKNNPIAYVGQILAVVTVEAEASTVDVYKIENAAGDLVPVGNTKEADAAIEAIEDSIDLLVENIEKNALDITTANEAIESIKEEIGVAAEGDAAATGLYKLIEDAKAEATYDDTALAGRVKAIEDDYLDSSDMDEVDIKIETSKEEAVAAAKTETENQISAVVSQYLTGEGAAETIDTLQEIVDWLNSEGKGADKIVADVEAIKADYLKGTDKTELQGNIDEVDIKLDALEAFVGTLPEGTVSTTVIAYIQEVVDGLKIGDYAKASELTALAEKVTTLENKVEAIEDDLASRLAIKSVDDATLVLGDDGKLVVGTIAQSQVAGLPEALEGKVNTQTSEYKGEQKAWTLLSPENQEKLASLVVGENGVEVSGKVNADNVEGLGSWITTNKNSVEGLVSDDLATKIAGAVQDISIDGIVLSKGDSNVIALPIASTTLGLVKSSDVENGISINEDGTMTVNEINVNKLVQTEGDELILFGGSANTLSKSN